MVFSSGHSETGVGITFFFNALFVARFATGDFNRDWQKDSRVLTMKVKTGK